MEISKILLINPSIQSAEEYDDCVNASVYPHLGLMTIAASIKASFPEIEVLIIDTEITGMKEVKNSIAEFQPDIVGLSILSPTYISAIQIAKYAKFKGVKYVVAGNDHASFFPELLLKRKDSNGHYFDFVIKGDNGEIDFVDLIRSLKDDKDPMEHMFNIFKKNCIGILNSPSRNLQFRNQKDNRKSLAGLDLIAPKQYYRYVDNYNTRFGQFHSKRIYPVLINNAKGCINSKNHCLYCSIYDLSVQFGEPEIFWKTIKKHHSNYGTNFFFEVCDNFGGMKKYRKQLIETMPDWFVNSDIEVMVYTTALAVSIDKDLIDDFKKLHIRRVNIGIDSANKNSLSELRKGHSNNVAVEINRTAIEKLSRAGIQIHSSFVLGALGETEFSLNQTMDFVRWMSKFEEVIAIELSSLYPLPNSPAWDIFLGNEGSKFYNGDLNNHLKVLGFENLEALWEKTRTDFDNNDRINLHDAAEIWANNFTYVPYKIQQQYITEMNTELKRLNKIIGAFS